MRRFSIIYLILILTLACADAKTHTPSGAYPKQLPRFALNDPHGKRYDSEAFKDNNVILVVTAPTLENKDSQEGWNRYLENAARDKDTTVVFLEDMTPSSFKDSAKKRMQKEYDSGAEPVLLLDTTGEIRKQLHVEPAETVVLVYDKKKGLVHAETKPPSKAGAKRIQKSLDP